ncbi:MAG: hypothetical protein ACUVRX_09655 [Actinomycetota bacterium]
MEFTYGTEEWEKAYQEELVKRMEAEPKPYIHFTPEWVALYEKAINEDAAYRELARNWEGSVVLHVEKAPSTDWTSTSTSSWTSGSGSAAWCASSPRR